MRVLRTSREIAIGAPSKVNLFLELLGKRPDGFHELATLMVGLSLRDTLAISDRSDGAITLTCNWSELSTGPDNLIVKAARLLQQRTGIQRGATIRLAKRIPIAAGLAGGSTDAAATLLGLNSLWSAGLATSELARLAADLGSDIAFFFSLPAAWCTGRGEFVEPLIAPRAFDVVLVFPPFGCDTASVYRQTTLPTTSVSGENVRLAFATGCVDALAKSLHNRLELAAEIVAPPLIAIKDVIAKIAPLGCRMSGSGSTLFALTRSRTEAIHLVEELRTRPELAGCGIRAVRTLKSHG